MFDQLLHDPHGLDIAGDPDLRAAGIRPHAPDEAFEWVTLLDAIADANRRFTMLELGAGYGRWTVIAAAVLRRYRPDLRHRLLAVEAEPTHYRWLRRHAHANDLRRFSRLGTCRLLNAAVSGRAGRDRFYTGNPREWYGQALVRPENQGADAPVTEVRTITLSSLLKPLDRADLIDLDIQGAELEVLAEAAPTLGRTRRVYVETHSPDVDRLLPVIFERAPGRWRSEISVPIDAQRMTALGEADFSGGGIQVWRNETAPTT